jgi:hypothetical protein
MALRWRDAPERIGPRAYPPSTRAQIRSQADGQKEESRQEACEARAGEEIKITRQREDAVKKKAVKKVAKKKAKKSKR